MGVIVDVGVLVAVAVAVDVVVGVMVGVRVGVCVIVKVAVGVTVEVGVSVRVAVKVGVIVGVNVLVGVKDGVCVLVGVCDGVNVLVGTGVFVNVGVIVGVAVQTVEQFEVVKLFPVLFPLTVKGPIEFGLTLQPEGVMVTDVPSGTVNEYFPRQSVVSVPVAPPLRFTTTPTMGIPLLVIVPPIVDSTGVGVLVGGDAPYASDAKNE